MVLLTPEFLIFSNLRPKKFHMVLHGRQSMKKSMYMYLGLFQN
jgi:hypothetical protein